MKRPQPDIGDIIRNEFISNLKTVRGLKRLWGTQIVDGVEVFTPRQYYFAESDRSENFEKLFKFIGAYDDVTTQDYEGIRSAWFYFNKNKGIPLTIDQDDFVSANLNRMWWDDNDGARPAGLTLTTSIAIDAYNLNSTLDTRINEIINANMPTSVAIQSLSDNFEELWDLCPISQEGVGIINKGSIQDSVNQITIPDEDDLTPDDPWLSTIARYALRSSGIPHIIKDISIGTLRRNSGPYEREYYTTFIVDIEIPYIEFTSGDSFVNNISNDLVFDFGSSTLTNGFKTQQQIRAMDSTDLEDDVDLITRSYILWEDQAAEVGSLNESLWFNYLGTWYLRAEPFNNPRASGLTYRQLNGYILSLLDSGYKKEKIKWYKKYIAFVLFVVAFYLALVPGAQGLSAQIAAVAAAIVTASLVLTLALLAFAILGMQDWVSAFAAVSKFLEPLVMVATVVVLVNGVSKAIAEEAAKDAVKRSTAEIVLDLIESGIESFVDNIVAGATDVFAGNVLTNAALSFTTKLFKILNFGMQIKLESIQERNKDLKAEYDKLVEEMNRETDALQGFAKIYGKPATADWSMYASQFDMPYERGGGVLSLGNVQRTTKQALRKAEYNDPAFAGILII